MNFNFFLYRVTVTSAHYLTLHVAPCRWAQDWNDTIKHQRSLLCFNGTFNKTDISSSQQQCLDREGEGGRGGAGVAAGWGFSAVIGWLLLISENWIKKIELCRNTVWGRWRGVCALNWLICVYFSCGVVWPMIEQHREPRAQPPSLPLLLTYLQGKLIHSVNSLSNKAN